MYEHIRLLRYPLFLIFLDTIENSLFLNANIVNVQDGLTLSNNIMKDGYVKNDAKIESPVYFMVPNYAQTPEDTEILAKMFDDNGNTILSRMVVQSYFNFTVENANHENETVVPSEYTQINGIWYFKTTHDLDEGNYTVYINLTDYSIPLLSAQAKSGPSGPLFMLLFFCTRSRDFP